MNGRRRKIIAGVPVIVIGLPVASLLTACACFSIMDKTNGTILSSGVTRRYRLYVPKSYDRSKATPLVISIHPAATWPAVEMNISRWNDLAEQHGFIVVYPAGSGAFLVDSAQVHMCGPTSLGRDVRFISDLIDKLEAEYNIDPRHIYADGMSNGGGMAFALSCKLSDRDRGRGSGGGRTKPVVGLVWGFQAGAVCRVSWNRRPLRTLPGRGIADCPRNIVPEYSGLDGPCAQRNQCKGDPSDTRVTASVRRLPYTNCAESADVILYTIKGGGHTWPGGKPLAEWMTGHTTNDINASRVMWEFFIQHPRGAK